MDRKTILLNESRRPVNVKVKLILGDIHVKGYEGTEVIIEAWPHGKGPSASVRKTAGAKELIASNAALFSPCLIVQEEDDIVTAGLLPSAVPMDMWIQVPFSTNLKLQNTGNGGIHVERINGDIEANILNGEILLARISGSVVAYAMNGRVQVDYSSAAPAKPLSFSTVNGNLSLTFPPKLRAKVRLDTLTGKIACDFELRTNPASGRLRGKDRSPRPVSPGVTVAGMIGAGGPAILVKSVNGSIHLRKKS